MPRHADGPRDRWWVTRADLPSREGWPATWVSRTLLARFLSVELDKTERHDFKQAKAGRLGPNTRYVEKTKTFRLYRLTQRHLITHNETVMHA